MTKYLRWIEGIRTLDRTGLADRCGEPDVETESMAALVLPIHREVVITIAPLRDVYRHRSAAGDMG